MTHSRKKLTYQYVKEQFKDRKYILLSKEYKNCNEKRDSYECHKLAHEDIGCRYSDLRKSELCREEMLNV